MWIGVDCGMRCVSFNECGFVKGIRFQFVYLALKVYSMFVGPTRESLWDFSPGADEISRRLE